MRKLPFLLFLFILILSEVLLTSQTDESEREEKEKAPDYEISFEEKELYKRRSEHYNQSGSIAGSTPLGAPLENGDNFSYANGKVNGTWSYKTFKATGAGGKGYRTVRSAYDKENDVFYLVSDAQHLWRVDYDETDPAKTTWEIRNHKSNFNGLLELVNLEDGSPRLIRVNGNKIQYSNDEGRSFQNATGGGLGNNSYQGVIQETPTGPRIVVIGKSNSKHQPFLSTDRGLSYTKFSTTVDFDSHDANVVKPSYTEDVYFFTRNKNQQTLKIYKLTPEATEFKLVQSPSFNTSGLGRVFGTRVNGVTHFYTTHSNSVIYYSDDEGATWTQTRSTAPGGSGDRQLRAMHHDKPNVVFRGYLDVHLSTDNGATFSGTSHKLGWDVQHMKTYTKKDGRPFLFIGNDFGAFISHTPDDKDSYFQLNNGTPIQMAYDMAVSPTFNTVFTATQDRGTRGFKDNEAPSTNEVRSTDGLRAEIAGNGRGIWTWMYFGSMFHKLNFGYSSDNSRQEKSFAGNWTANAMAASPDSTEDAIYIGGSTLRKFLFNPTTKKIEKSDHHYNFNDLEGDVATGVGFSYINPDKWFVSIKNGNFYYSHNGGQSFTQATQSGTKPKANDQQYNYTKNQQVIKASRLDENVVYYAGVANSFMISRDGGKSFSNHNNGLDIYRIRDFDMSPDEKYIFAACAKAGPWVYSVDEDQWYDMDGPAIPSVDFTSVIYNGAKNKVQFGTYGNGVIELKLDLPDNILQAPIITEITPASHQRITLQWEKQSTGDEEFIIERLSDGGTFLPIITLSSEYNVFHDAGLDAEKQYFYRIRSVANNQGGPFSVGISATTLTEGAIDSIFQDSAEIIIQQTSSSSFSSSSETSSSSYSSSKDSQSSSSMIIVSSSSQDLQSSSSEEMITPIHKHLRDYGIQINIITNGINLYLPQSAHKFHTIEIYDVEGKKLVTSPISENTESHQIISPALSHKGMFLIKIIGSTNQLSASFSNY